MIARQRSPVHVRLTRKLAEVLNGFDLRPFAVGQVIDLADPFARMLVLEQWAEEVVSIDVRTTADDRSRKRRPRARRSR
jgi:hypothetical protein